MSLTKITMPTNAATLIWTDGASRGNPGPSAIGVVIKYNSTTIPYYRRIPDTTNNAAELHAIAAALRTVLAIPEAYTTSIIVHSDSQWCVNVLSSIWRAKTNRALVAGIEELVHQLGGLERVTFQWIPREENTEVDRLANAAFDQPHRNESIMTENGKGPIAKAGVKVSKAGFVKIDAWQGQYPANVQMTKSIWNKPGKAWKDTKFSFPAGQLSNVIKALQQVETTLRQEDIKTDDPEIPRSNGKGKGTTAPETQSPETPAGQAAADPALVEEITRQVTAQILAKQQAG